MEPKWLEKTVRWLDERGYAKDWEGDYGTFVVLPKAFVLPAPAVEAVDYFVGVVVLPNDASQVLFTPAACTR